MITIFFCIYQLIYRTNSTYSEAKQKLTMFTICIFYIFLKTITNWHLVFIGVVKCSENFGLIWYLDHEVHFTRAAVQLNKNILTHLRVNYRCIYFAQFWNMYVGTSLPSWPLDSVYRVYFSQIVFTLYIVSIFVR